MLCHSALVVGFRSETSWLKCARSVAVQLSLGSLLPPCAASLTCRRRATANRSASLERSDPKSSGAKTRRLRIGTCRCVHQHERVRGLDIGFSWWGCAHPLPLHVRRETPLRPALCFTGALQGDGHAERPLKSFGTEEEVVVSSTNEEAGHLNGGSKKLLLTVTHLPPSLHRLVCRVPTHTPPGNEPRARAYCTHEAESGE